MGCRKFYLTKYFTDSHRDVEYIFFADAFANDLNIIYIKILRILRWNYVLAKAVGIFVIYLNGLKPISIE